MKKFSLVITACSMGIAAQAQLIDDFSGTLSPYTQTIVLAQNGDPALTFSISSGALQVNRPAVGSGSGSAQQDLFLRNDFSLGVGNTLRVDTSVFTNALYSDFGIAVSATVNPPAAVWTTGTVSTRQNYINVYVKGQSGTVGTIGFDGTTQAFSSTGPPVPGGYPALTGIYISRPSTSEYDVGYITASGGTLIHAYTGIVNTSIGTALGFYADLRAASDTFGTLDNLRLEPIPEPASMSFFGLGGALGLLAWMRRRLG